MRIGLVSPYSFDVPGGVQLHVRDLATYLLAEGHEVSVLAPSDGDDAGALAQQLVELPARQLAGLDVDLGGDHLPDGQVVTTEEAASSRSCGPCATRSRATP